jgi:PhnB protein
MTVNPIPEGYHTVTPYLSVPNAASLIAFLVGAFEALEVERHAMPDGRIINAQIRVGNSMMLIADSPSGREPAPATFYMYVSDVDAAYLKAVSAGGVAIKEPYDEFYGDRIAAVEDPAQNRWFFASHREDMSEEELVKRALVERA